MKKKLVSLLLAGTLALSLGGCGLFGSEEKGTSEDENTLTVWCWDQASYIRAMEEAQTAYQEEHPEFKLEISEYSWDQIEEKLQEAAKEEDVAALPDIILAPDSYFMDEQEKQDPSDLFLPLDESGIDFSKFDQRKVQQTQTDGVQYGVPFDLGTVVQAVRTDLLEKAGYTVDDFTDITWEQFLELGKAVKAKTGVAMLTVIRDGQLQQTIPEDIYQEMKAENIVIEVDSEDQYISAIAGEEAAAVIDTYYVFGEIMSASIGEGSWAVTNVPAENEGTHYVTTGGNSWLVTRNSEKKDLTFAFLNDVFGNDVDYYEKLMKKTGLMGSYLPIQETDEYNYPQEYFSSQTLYLLLTDYNERAWQNR